MSSTSSGMSTHRSVETSWRMSAIGKSGARSSGPIGWPVPGCSGGCAGLGMSAAMLYQRRGSSGSGGTIFVSSLETTFHRWHHRHGMHRVLWLVALAAVGAAHGAAVARPDPPLLVPWHRVGDLTLGEPRRSVERGYGRTGTYGAYRLHGSRVDVEFRGGRLDAVGFSTPYYRTRTGFGVGSMIPPARVTAPRATAASIAGVASSGTPGSRRSRANAGRKSASAAGPCPRRG